MVGSAERPARYIAVVDDDPDFAGQVARYLSRHGLDVRQFHEPESLLAALDEDPPALVLLDQVLGAASGLETLRRMRALSAVPCVFLTGLDDEIDRVVSLESGADDYISKTATPREILARIRAVLRRTAVPVPEGAAHSEPVRAGWRFSVERRELRRPDGTIVPLTTAEFELLRALHEAEGTPVDRESLFRQVLARSYRPDDRSIDNLVAKLRRKIEPDPSQPSVIQSVRPLGYVFTGFPLDSAAGRKGPDGA